MITHVLAYSKGWLPKSKDIYLDLFTCLMSDGYTPGSDKDVFEIIKNNFCKFYNTLYLDTLLTAISEENSYSYGYWTKGNCRIFDKSIKINKYPKYDYRTALMYYIVNYFRMLDNEQLSTEQYKQLNNFINNLKK